MSNVIYPAISRQVGLQREMDIIAQNIANASTTGYRAEGIVFSEHVMAPRDGSPSTSFATAAGRHVRQQQGALEATGGALDLAIEGEGFFQVDVDGTPHLTRAGAFVAGPDGGVVTVDGHLLLDQGGAPVVVPPGSGSLHVGEDGTLSADGRPLSRIGVVLPADPDALTRRAGTLFRAGETQPAPDPSIRQGYLEASNVDPVLQIARMIAVQNAYQMAQGFMDREDERNRALFRLLDQ